MNGDTSGGKVGGGKADSNRFHEDSVNSPIHCAAALDGDDRFHAFDVSGNLTGHRPVQEIILDFNRRNAVDEVIILQVRNTHIIDRS